jgi:hypothetical protein
MLSEKKWFVLSSKEVDGSTKYGIESPKNDSGIRGIVSDETMIPCIYDSIQVVKADEDKEIEWCIHDLFVGTRLDDEGNKVYDVYKPWHTGGPPVCFHYFGFNCLKENLYEFPTYESIKARRR